MRMFSLLLLLISVTVNADTSNCLDLYVGAITARSDRTYVVFKNAKDSTSGSYDQNFDGWPADEKRLAVSLLLSAKMSGHRVNVTTQNANGCGIQDGGGTLRYVQLSNLP